MNALIREAQEKDLDAIRIVVTSAFGAGIRGGPDSNGEGEARLIEELIRDGDVLVSLVAEDTQELPDVIGHVLVSPMSLDPDTGLICGGVAPLSVLPRFQSSGIGGLLMRAAIAQCRDRGLDALFLLGDPNYYQRFGFSVSSVGNDYGATEHFQQLELKDSCLDSVEIHAHYAAAFTRVDV